MYVLENGKALTITLSNVGWSSCSMKISENPYLFFYSKKRCPDFCFSSALPPKSLLPALKQLSEYDMFNQWPRSIQVWSSSLKPLLSGLSWACLEAADVCLAGHVRTDCSYSGCQLYIQTSQQDIWWLPFFLCRWNSLCPLFHNSVQKNIILWVLWLLIQTFEVYGFLFPLQVTSTAACYYSNIVWLHSAVSVIFCHFLLYIIWCMDDFKIGCVRGKR